MKAEGFSSGSYETADGVQVYDDKIQSIGNVVNAVFPGLWTIFKQKLSNYLVIIYSETE